MQAKPVQKVLCFLAVLAVPSLLPATSLPPLPKIKTAHLFPSVLQQVRVAYQAALAHPMDAEANGKLAMVLDTYEQYSLAQICYLRAHRLDPNSFDWAYDLGYVQNKQGQYTEAVESLRQALKLRPDYLPAQLKLAESLFAAGQTDAPDKLYQQIAQQHPGSAEAGVALSDYDNDGDLDIYFLQDTMLEPGRKPLRPAPPRWKPGNRLFRNMLSETGRLHFVDVTEKAGVGHIGYAMGVAVGDYDYADIPGFTR